MQDNHQNQKAGKTEILCTLCCVSLTGLTCFTEGQEEVSKSQFQ